MYMRTKKEWLLSNLFILFSYSSRHYRVSHSKEGKVILLWWGYRFLFLLIFWILRVYEIEAFTMPKSSVLIFFSMLRALTRAKLLCTLSYEITCRAVQCNKCLYWWRHLKANAIKFFAVTIIRKSLVRVHAILSAHWSRMFKTDKKEKKRHLLPVLGLMSDSWMTISVESHWCPLHQFILRTQGPILLNFAKKYWELTVLKNIVFLSRPFWIFFSNFA